MLPNFEDDVLLLYKTLKLIITEDVCTLNGSALSCLAATSTDNDLIARSNYYNANLVGKEWDYLLHGLYNEFCIKNLCTECPVAKLCNRYIVNEREKVSSSDLTMVDLFCGAGGLSLGFTQEGFNVCLANDIEECCVETYSYNHPNVPSKYIVQGNINDIIPNIEKYLRFPDIDLVVGGPPCQGFSMANRQRVIDDPRNVLYKSYVQVVDKVKPKFFVMENVRGMLTVSKQIIEDFNNIGYSVTCQIFNVKDFGVPQSRERVIFIGNRLGINNNNIFDDIIDLAKKMPNTVLKDALYGLQPLEASRKRNETDIDSKTSGSLIAHNNGDANQYILKINQGRSYKFVYNHKARYNNERDIEIYRRLEQGDNSTDAKIADIMPYARRNGIFKDKYYKLEENKICKTITAHMKFDCNMYIHPTQARGLTPREAARIQSFPDDYVFRGAYTKTYMQVGNSVPPLLSRVIAQIIKKYIEEAKL